MMRPCTCHPDDLPPVPCEQQYAFSACAEAFVKRHWFQLPLKLRQQWWAQTGFGARPAELSSDTWRSIREAIGAKRN